MVDEQLFAYNETDIFPNTCPANYELIKKTELANTMNYLFYDWITNFKQNFMDKGIRYIGVYVNNQLTDVIKIDFDNPVNTMTALIPYMKL